MITLGENQYGKSRVRVMKVHRHPGRNELHDWTVELLLQGDFQSCFIDGDKTHRNCGCDLLHGGGRFFRQGIFSLLAISQADRRT